MFVEKELSQNTVGWRLFSDVISDSRSTLGGNWEFGKLLWISEVHAKSFCKGYTLLEIDGCHTNHMYY